MRSPWQLEDLLTDVSDLRLRKARPGDEPFLLQLFHSNRPHLSEIPLPREFVAELIQQQFNLQRRSYLDRFPGCIDFLILLNQEPIGNLKLHNDNDGCLNLLDIAMLPSYFSRGHGRTLLRVLQTLATLNDWILRVINIK